MLKDTAKGVRMFKKTAFILLLGIIFAWGPGHEAAAEDIDIDSSSSFLYPG